MIGKILTLFIFVVMSDCTTDNKAILQKISFEENVCNNDKLFKHFQFSDIPEFGAMCNIPVPNEKIVEILLEKNVVPVLCMGVYDVSLRLCNEAVNDTIYFKEFFPPSTEQFAGIFNTLKQSEEYSDLNKFCSDTVKKHNEIEPASDITKFWWQILGKKLSINESCRSICRTNEINQVHPLCSYIVWSNDLIHNHQHNIQQSEAINFEIPEENLKDNTVVQSDLPKITEDQILPDKSGNEPEKPLTSGPETKDSGHFLIPRPTQPQALYLGLNSTKKPIEVLNVEPNNNKEKEKTSTVMESAKSVLNTSVSNSALINNTDQKEIVKNEGTQDEKGNSPAEKLNPAGDSVPENKKVKGTDEIKPNEVSDKVDQMDFNGDIDIDSVPSDQPAGNDPETQQQLEEELEDDDDVDVGEDPGKAASASKKTEDKSNKYESHKKQGKPDEEYSEVDRAILLQDPFVEAEDTHFFSYFLFMSLLTILAYLAFHNKNKLFALAVEGRRSKSSRRRPNSSNYSKLDCSLEEAMVSNTTASVTHVLY